MNSARISIEAMRKFGAGLLLTALLIASACRGPDDPETASGPVVSLDGIGYSVGLESAPVTVVEFSDFGCPFCAGFASDTYPALHAEFVEPGLVRWIFVPFVLGMFPNGDVAALVAECAGDQDRFWPMHDLLYEYQYAWRREGSAGDIFAQLANATGLNREDFERCVANNEPRIRIDRQNRTGQRLGIRATPTFVVNGRMVEGALPAAQFRTLLEFAIAAAPERPGGD